MKLSTLATLLSLSLILILSGCASKPKPASKEDAVIDATLPKIKLTTHGVKTGMKSISLEWKSIKDKRVNGVFIYRDDKYLDTIDNPFSTHYFDSDIKPNQSYAYYFKTYSIDAQSVKSETTLIKSKSILDSVSWIHATNDMPKSAKIIWRPHTNKLVSGYRLQRRALEENEFRIITNLDGRLRAEYIDYDLKDKHTYVYRLFALTYNKIISNPSEEIEVTTKGLPQEVKNIKATNNKPKKIVITWEKSNIKDFLKYNVYRSQEQEGGYELIASISKNSYSDVINEDGMKYFYRVSTVDKDALESNYELNFAKGLTLVKPKAPTILDSRIVDGSIIIKWSKTDDRTKTYIVSKKYKNSMFDTIEEEFDGIKNTSFHDTKIQAQTKYFYKVYSVDKNNIRSKESKEIELETKKAEEI